MFAPSELAAMTDEIEMSLGPGSGLGVSVVLLRGTATLPAQEARLVRPGGAGTASGSGTESAQAMSQHVGKPDMDIRARDKFNLGGLLYEVVAVMPQRQISTTAQVRSLQ